MDRIINIKVKGNHLTKDSNNAGTRGEANVTTLRITFGDDWNAYVKKILFWDAHGMNPTKKTLIPEWKENSDTNVYLFNIPPSALGIAGNMTFRIDGYIENKRQRSVSATLEVEDALIEADIEEVSQSDLDNLLAQGENIKKIINKGVNETFGYRNEALEAQSKAEAAQTAAETAKTDAETAKRDAEGAKKAAESAQTAAETAASNAVTAQKAAESAKNDASGFAGDAEQAKRDAETARDEARGYADNFESLAEAVSKAENAKEGAAGSADDAFSFKGEAETSASNAAQSASNAKTSETNAKTSETNAKTSETNAKTSETNAKTHEEYALAYRNLASESEKAAWQHKIDAENAKNEAAQSAINASSVKSDAVLAKFEADAARNDAQAYANNAENAVSQSRYIGANGNWYVWDSSKKTFVDSGETAHAGSTVYVGSNPPSNAQVWIDPDDDSDIAMSIKEIYNTIKSMKPKAVTITLLSSAWVVDGDRYAQIVSIPEATAYSKVDLQPSAEQLTIFHEKDIAFVTENVGGTITVYCIGQKPTNDYTIQATITEVSK